MPRPWYSGLFSLESTSGTDSRKFKSRLLFPRNSLGGRPLGLRQRPGGRQRHRRMVAVRKHLGRHDVWSPAFRRWRRSRLKAELQTPPELPGCMVAVCQDHADLKIARVIPRSKFDFPMAIFPVMAVRQHLGREPLQPDVGKTDRRHRAVKIFQSRQLGANMSARR